MEWMLMPLKRYAEFSGRSRRQEFWMWQVFKFLLGIAASIVLAVFGASIFTLFGGGGTGGAAALIGAGLIVYGILLLASLALIIPDLAVTVRRLHDTGKSGWLILLPLAGYVIVFVGAALNSSVLTVVGGLAALGLAIALIVFMVLDGTPGTNRYGPDPKGRGEVVPAY